MEGITDVVYARCSLSVCQDFEIQKLHEYHDFYLQRLSLFLVFENLQNMCLEICELGTTYFHSAPG